MPIGRFERGQGPPDILPRQSLPNEDIVRDIHQIVIDHEVASEHTPKRTKRQDCQQATAHEVVHTGCPPASDQTARGALANESSRCGKSCSAADRLASTCEL